MEIFNAVKLTKANKFFVWENTLYDVISWTYAGPVQWVKAPAPIIGFL